MSAADVQILMDMGFSKDHVERALNATGHKGVEPAMDWLLSHGPEIEEESRSAAAAATATATSEPRLDLTAAAGTPAATTTTVTDNGGSSEEQQAGKPGEEQTAKSIKCDVCGKLFQSNLEVEFHATKSGHDQFSESSEEKKPLTEEQKRQQLQLIEDKLKQKRAEREEKEKQEALERERDRIRSGKEMAEARKKLEELEMKKILEQRRREKEEDRMARQRIREQIEADRAARRLKAQGGSEAAAAQAAVAPAPVAKPPVAQNTNNSSQNYTETRLQIRLTDGKSLTQSFGCKEQLAAVRLYVEMHRTDGAEPFDLMTTFPRKVFAENEYDMPLDLLGLVPSAVVIVKKKSVV
ncbi:unnamed protein product [Trichogramma brassicae]|uniref:UBX domain-containing protein n=1 Tax=Trichogramma brassicae TaxID=86971 RepID=A0A6H5I982_9HYME|nr:unnamed protein product [Trichogramma brassicae]